MIIRNLDPTSTVIETHISSFTPTFQDRPINEAKRGPLSLKGNHTALDAEIDNLMEYEGIENLVDPQTEVEDSIPTNLPTTPLSLDHSPSPPPPEPESHHNLEPPSSPPLEAQTSTNPIPYTQQTNRTIA